jgi:hypothetical protein
MPAFGEGDYFPPLAVLSMTGDGYHTVTVTCSTAHNLVTNNQVSVEGASVPAANGAFSVMVNGNPLIFSYYTNTTIPLGSLLSGSTVVYQVNIGLPYNYAQLPQTGV